MCYQLNFQVVIFFARRFAIKYDENSTKVMTNSKERAILDSGSSLIYGPDKYVQAIYDAGNATTSDKSYPLQKVKIKYYNFD